MLDLWVPDIRENTVPDIRENHRTMLLPTTHPHVEPFVRQCTTGRRRRLETLTRCSRTREHGLS
jgi:hypothetical protein